MGDALTGLLGLGGLAASAYLPYSNAGGQIDYLKGQIPTYLSKAEDITNRAVGEAQFTPFTVKTGTGQTSIGAGGAMEQTLGAQGQAIQSGLLGQAQQGATAQVDPTMYNQLQQQALQGAQGLLGAPTASAQDIYAQMQASQAGEQQRAQLGLENRLAAQGRLGVQTAAYGGTPEQLAMQKAIQEQQSSNWLQAQQLAPQLQAQQAANATSMFGLGSAAGMNPYQQQAAGLQNTMAALQGGYMPEQQGLAALQTASPFSQLATSAALSRAEQLSSGGQYGLEALVGGNANIAQLEAARVDALAKSLSGMFTASSATQQSPLSVFLKELGIGIDPTTTGG